MEVCLLKQGTIQSKSDDDNIEDKRRKLFEARRSHLSQSKYVNEQHLGKEKFTVSQILREFDLIKLFVIFINEPYFIIF